MTDLDEFPKRGPNCPIQAQSEAMFRNAISICGEFEIQPKRENDYGVDFVIEACEANEITNVTICVQLKGTEKEQNKDGSVSVSVKRTNLNYLLMSPGSLYVCCHIPTERLLVRQADDLFRIGERKSGKSTIAVRFSEEFDEEYQRKLRAIVVTFAKDSRDHRLQYATCPPEKISSLLSEEPFDISIPKNQQQAEEQQFPLSRKVQSIRGFP
ncbi:MAG: DUF4365 domain-containing protein, partial [Acidimicrobiia bacterium]|nr:DUF4365 domain-containing protein [Acidimicrobiia bacterium]MYE62770.1 DUF4365 domain-containing protein [Rhodothermaceae bacterium]MYJ20545.1 DUF4365 domain-containing protein [Rhodothermaceae bacterium]